MPQYGKGLDDEWDGILSPVMTLAPGSGTATSLFHFPSLSPVTSGSLELLANQERKKSLTPRAVIPIWDYHTLRDANAELREDPESSLWTLSSQCLASLGGGMCWQHSLWFRGISKLLWWALLKWEEDQMFYILFLPIARFSFHCRSLPFTLCTRGYIVIFFAFIFGHSSIP